jgi:hypothetical protein
MRTIYEDQKWDELSVQIVALDHLEGWDELGMHIGEKIGENTKNVRFEVKRKNPSVVSAIIKNDKIIFVTWHTNNRKCSKITIY